MNYKNFKICCNFCPRYIEMFQASVIAEKSWTKVNKNGWKNSFWKFPTEKFIWIQLLELLTDQNEAAIFGYSIKFYVKIELANCVRHLWDHSSIYQCSPVAVSLSLYWPLGVLLAFWADQPWSPTYRLSYAIESAALLLLPTPLRVHSPAHRMGHTGPWRSSFFATFDSCSWNCFGRRTLP